MERSLRGLLVTSWGVQCGIAEHSQHLKAAVEAVDTGIRLCPSAETLDPEVGIPVALGQHREMGHFDFVVLNHHDALHSRWLPHHVETLTGKGLPVIVIFHDTRSGALGCENSEKLKAFAQVASSVIVHEPVEDVQAIYWRQGVPRAAQSPVEYSAPPMRMEGDARAPAFKSFPQQPVLGSIGFNFPWKQYDELARVTGEEGWALVLLSNDATEADEARWRAANSSILVIRKFLPQDQAINYLAGCDATAFMYSCANNGTSGAIRQGIAARKPVIALESCRQFRDLYLDALGRDAIQWVRDWDELRETLRRIPPTRLDPMIHALAERESWKRMGENYAKLYHTLVQGGK